MLGCKCTTSLKMQKIPIVLLPKRCFTVCTEKLFQSSVIFAWHKFVCASAFPEKIVPMIKSVQNLDWVTLDSNCDKVSSVRTVFSWPPFGVSSVWVGSRRRQADRLTVMSLDCNRESRVTAQTSDKTLSEKTQKTNFNWRKRRDAASRDEEERGASYCPAYKIK